MTPNERVLEIFRTYLSAYPPYTDNKLLAFAAALQKEWFGEPKVWMVKCGQGSEGFATEQWQIYYFVKDRRDCVVTPLYTAPADKED